MRLAWLTAFVLLTPGAALAENFEEFAFGARAQGMGGAFTALASDSTATYYNPAGLIFSRHLNLNFGFSFADYGLEFDSQRGLALDGKAERIPDLSAFSLGLSTTIPWDVPDRLGFGLAIFVPTRGAINLDVTSITTRPEWFSYGKRHDRLHVLLAGGVKVTDWFSLGVGASIFVDAIGGTTISTGVNEPVNPEFRLKLKPDAGLVLGALFFPADWLSFGLTYRSEISFKLDFPANAKVQGRVNIPLGLETISFFSPHQVQAGVAVDVGESLLLTFDVSWVGWSTYKDVFLVETSTVAAVPARQRVDLDDVFSPKLGAEYSVNDLLTLRAGYWYRSSRVPSQSSPVITNLVDSDKHVFTLGVGFSFGQPPERVSDEAKESKGRSETLEEALVDASADLDLFFQYHLHTSVSATKDATDPLGSWDAGGDIINFGFTLTLRF